MGLAGFSVAAAGHAWCSLAGRICSPPAPAQADSSDRCAPFHIRTGTRLVLPTSAPGLGLPLSTSAPGLGLPLSTSAPARGLTPPTSAPRLGPTPPTSSRGLGSPRPHLHRAWAPPLYAGTDAPSVSPARYSTRVRRNIQHRRRCSSCWTERSICRSRSTTHGTTRSLACHSASRRAPGRTPARRKLKRPRTLLQRSSLHRRPCWMTCSP
jgi:hypothetical protein